MFDRPEWWQVLLLITPISLIIQGLKWREHASKNTSYRALSPAQNGWVLLHFLPPGDSARVWAELSQSERDGYLEAGQQLRGSGRGLAAPLVKHVYKLLAALEPTGSDLVHGKGKRKPPSTESNDPLEKLALMSEFCLPDLVRILRKDFPAPQATPGSATPV